MEVADCIKAGDTLILKKESNLKIYKLWKKRKVFLDRKNFLLDAAIDQPFGSVWEVRNDNIVQVPYSVLQAEALDIESTGDNRSIVDDTSSQKMSREDILSLKGSGQSGEKIIDQIVENSSSFKDKNVYSQAKYRKKKRDKHITRFQILRPSTRLLCEMHWNKAPNNRQIQLRADTLAQILSASNVQSGSKVMLIESTQGLVLGAVMERLAGNGTVVQFHSEDRPIRTAVDAYNFPKEHLDNVHSVILGQVGELLKEINGIDTTKEESSTTGDGRKTDVKETDKMDEDDKLPDQEMSVQVDSCDSTQNRTEDSVKTDDKNEDSVAMDASSKTGSVDGETKWKGKKRNEAPTEEEYQARQDKREQKQEAFMKVKDILKDKDMDVLIIVTRFQPSPILMALIDLLSLSRPFVVYCPNKEPLMECFAKLRERGGALSIKITETWLRNYQVLPNRTHPKVVMSGTGGYLLTGTTVEIPPPSKPSTSTAS